MQKSVQLSEQSRDVGVRGTLHELENYHLSQACVIPMSGASRADQFADCLGQTLDLLEGNWKTLTDSGLADASQKVSTKNVLAPRVFFNPGDDYEADVSEFKRQMIETGRELGREDEFTELFERMLFIPMPPVEGDVGVFCEMRYAKKDKPLEIEHRISPKHRIPYAKITHAGGTDYQVQQTIPGNYTSSGGHGRPLAERAELTHQAYRAFEEDILEPNGLTYHDIACSRNHIGGILEKQQTHDGKDIQCYQVVLNEPRAVHYGPLENFPKGMPPSATGIGVDGFDGCFFAVTLTTEELFPAQSPEQTSAFKYGGSELVGVTIGGEPRGDVPSTGASVRKPPYFSRALVFGDRNLIAGTACIREAGTLYKRHEFHAPEQVDVSHLARMKGGAEGLRKIFGEDMVSVDEHDRVWMRADTCALAHSMVTVDNIAALIHSDNLAQYGVHAESDLEGLMHMIVYIKRPEDADDVMKFHRTLFPDLPIFGGICDVCRPELEIEDEQEGLVRLKGK